MCQPRGPCLLSLSSLLSLFHSFSLSLPSSLSVWILWSSFAMWRFLLRIIHDRLSISYMIFEIEYVLFILLFLTSPLYYSFIFHRVTNKYLKLFPRRRMKRKEIYTKNTHKIPFAKVVTWLGFDHTTFGWMMERLVYIKQGDPEKEYLKEISWQSDGGGHRSRDHGITIEDWRLPWVIGGS